MRSTTSRGSCCGEEPRSAHREELEVIECDPVAAVNEWLAKTTPNLGSCPPRDALLAWLLHCAEHHMRNLAARDLIDRLDPEIDEDHTGDVVYDLAKIKATAPLCIDLEPGLLAVMDNDGWISFVVFSWHSGPTTKDGVVVDGEKMERLFHGCGPAGCLRELRHSYWGEGGNSGYISCLNGKTIINALGRLREWFDLD